MNKSSFVDANGHIHRNMKGRRSKRKKRQHAKSSAEKMFDDMKQSNPKTGNGLGYHNSIKGMKPVMKNAQKDTSGLGRCSFAYYAHDRRPTITENPQLSHCK